MLLFQVFFQSLLAHQIFLLFSPPVVESTDMQRSCLAANVQWGSMRFVLHMTPKNLPMLVSARKDILYHSSLRHSPLCDGVLSWLQHSAIACPFLCHSQGKTQLPIPFSVSSAWTPQALEHLEKHIPGT